MRTGLRRGRDANQATGKQELQRLVNQETVASSPFQDSGEHAPLELATSV